MSPMPEIYYADDDRDDIDIFTEAVKVLRERSAAHVNLHVYHSGDSLIKGISERLVDTGTIFLDINMPGMDGKKFLELAKQDAQFKTIPVIMFTSSQAPEDIRDCYERQASCYVVKPFDLKAFTEALIEVVDFWGGTGVVPSRA